MIAFDLKFFLLFIFAFIYTVLTNYNYNKNIANTTYKAKVNLA